MPMQVFEVKRLVLPAAGIPAQLRRNLRLPWPMTLTKSTRGQAEIS